MPAPVRAQSEGGISSTVFATQGRGSIRSPPGTLALLHGGGAQTGRLIHAETQPCRGLCVSLECHPFYSMRRGRQAEKSKNCFPQAQSEGLRNSSDKKRKQKMFNLQRTFFIRRKTYIRKIHCEKDFLCYKKEDKTLKLLLWSP